jgi:glutamyl-tRNA synthetase
MHLRIEDLDRSRVKPGMLEECLRDLEWLGLDWDGTPLVQSADLAPYHAAIERLRASGAAYACTCSRRDLELALGAPHAEDGERRYPGTCRGRYASSADAGRASGAPAGIRLCVPEGEIEVSDAIAGRVRVDVQSEVGDFLLARRDGAIAYQLAVVVDDARQGVTEVLRGSDLLPSAARQALVARALGFGSPGWAHVPLVVDDTGRRLAKRRDDLALAELRAGRVDPRAVVAWAARSVGQPSGERATAAELAPAFDLARLPREPVVLDPADLAALWRAR